MFLSANHTSDFGRELIIIFLKALKTSPLFNHSSWCGG